MQSHINIYYTLPIGAEVIKSTAPEKNNYISYWRCVKYCPFQVAL